MQHTTREHVQYVVVTALLLLIGLGLALLKGLLIFIRSIGRVFR